MPRPSSRFSTVNSWDPLSLLIQSFSRSRRCTMSVGALYRTLTCRVWSRCAKRDARGMSSLLLREERWPFILSLTCSQSLQCRLRHTALVCRRWGKQRRQTGRHDVLWSKCSDLCRKRVSQWRAHTHTTCSEVCYKETCNQAVAPSRIPALLCRRRDGKVAQIPGASIGHQRKDKDTS